MQGPGASAENGAGDRGPCLSIGLLGGFRVRVGETLLPDSVWRLSKARSLLKVLALAAGHRLPREQVVDLLWPDLPPEAAANNLHQTLHAVRRALRTAEGEAEVRLQHGVLALQPEGPLAVDVDAFEKAAATARGSDNPALYHRALALYGGDLLPDDRYEDWAAWRREGLRETFLQLLVGVARRHEARGELTAAMEALTRVIATEPTHEEACMALVRLYAATGQRARALRQYELLTQVLRTELDVEPDEASRRLYEEVLAGRFGAGGEGRDEEEIERRPMHNLPIALTSFVGREDEIAGVVDHLASARLVTLSGVAGAGKTRLALRVGWECVERFPDGVWWVPLAALRDPDLVPRSVATALQIAEMPGRPWTETIIAHLRGRRTLLILDNCEHLVDACARLATDLLSQCAGLEILTTSRTRLDVPGELQLAVRPLAIPAEDEETPERVRTSEAVRLFVERARFRRPSFALTAQTAPAIARICRQVEGVPLAIELAAARLGALSVGQIAAHLDNAPGLLTGGPAGDRRHQTLRAALDWSYDLLDGEQQALFRRLSVFAGGWILEQAAVLAEQDVLVVLDRITQLVDNSLVQVEGTAEEQVRYRLLEPVRQYARERLRRAGEEEETRRRHALVMVALAQEAEDKLRGTDARQWLDRLEVEHDNLRAALRWARGSGDLTVGLRIAAAIWRFWFTRGHLREGRALLAELLAAGGEDEAIPAAVRAGAFNAAGALAFFQTDYPAARSNYQAALALRRIAGDEAGTAATLSNLGLVAKDSGEYDTAVELMEQARVLQERLGQTRALASTIGNLGILAQESGEYERARELQEESLRLSRHVEGPLGGVNTLNNLGALALEMGDLDRARAWLDESAGIARRLGAVRSLHVATANLGHVARRQRRFDEARQFYAEALALAEKQAEVAAIAAALEGIAALQLAIGETRRATVLFGAADRVRSSVGAPLNPVDRTQNEAMLAAARATLGREFDAAWAEGESMTTDEAMALARCCTGGC